MALVTVYFCASLDDALSTINADDPAALDGLGEIRGYDEEPWLGYADRVAISGNYAFVTNRFALPSYIHDGVTVIDISDRENLSYAGGIYSSPAGGSPNYLEDATGIFILGNYAYVACKVDGLTILDISTPTSPTFVGNIGGAGSPNYLGGACSVYVVGDYAFVACEDDHSLVIIDVSDKEHPSLAGEIHGANPPNYLNTPVCVVVKGDYAYVACYGDDYFTIINVSDKEHPSFATTVDLGALDPEMGYPTCVFIDGDYAYVTEEYDENLVIIDISDPTSPVVKGHYNTENWNPHGVFVLNNIAYIANDDVLVTLDVSDKENPVELDYDDSNWLGVRIHGGHGIYVLAEAEVVTPTVTTNPATEVT